MKIFKTILTVILTIVFAFSLTLTILLSYSSNASLLFKYNDEKMLAIASSQRLAFDASYLLVEDSKNISIREETDTGSTYYNFNFDKNGNAKVEIKENGKSSFYKDSILDICGPLLTKLNLLQDLIIEDITASNTKSKAYFKWFNLGIKYTIKEEDRTITYIYSLKGDLKEINLSSSTNNLKYVIEYDSNDIPESSFE